MTEYPTAEDIISINKSLMERVKVTKAERHGLLAGREVLEDIVKEVKTAKGDLYDKAAVLLVRLVQKHPFESGNRRTAFLATEGFLEVNGSKMNIDRETVENVLKGVRERFYSLDDIIKWLRTGDIHEFKRR